MEVRRRRVYEAAREGLRLRLINQWRLPTERAEALLREWDDEAAKRSLDPKADGYWRQAEVWLSEHQTGR